MSLVRFQMTPDARALARELGVSLEELKDWRPVWTHFLPVLAQGQAEAMKAFAFPNAPAYAARKGGRPVGFLTGALYARLRSSFQASAAVTRSTMKWGPGIKYAYVLHYGALAGRTKRERRRLRRSFSVARGGGFGLRMRQVARPYLGWTDTLTAALLLRMHERVEGLLERAAERAAGTVAG